MDKAAKGLVKFPRSPFTKSTLTPAASIAVLANPPLIKGDHWERIVLTAATVPVTAAADYGSLELLTFPDEHLLLIGGRLVGNAVVDGTGIVAATDISLGLGLAAIAATNWGGASDDNVMGNTAYTTDALSRAVDKGFAPNLLIAKGASNKLYLNGQSTITTDGSIAFTGYLDLYWKQL